VNPSSDRKEAENNDGFEFGELEATFNIVDNTSTERET